MDEQMKAKKKKVKPGVNAGDWKQARLEADSLLRSLHDAHSEDEKHRKWLLKRWPEWSREGSSGSLPDPERFIPECYLRKDEDDVSESLLAIKNTVKKSVGLLDGEDGEDGQLYVPKVVAGLSDGGIVESLPLLLPKMQSKALQSFLSKLSGRERKAKNREWLIEKTKKDWMTFADHAQDNKASSRILQQVLKIVREPRSFRELVSPEQMSLKASCPYTAAISAMTLTHLEQLPLQCLHVMLEVFLEKPPGVMIGKLPVGSNKERLVNILLEKCGDLLSYYEPGDALPENLRRSLLVMSVSARYAFGDDGNLIDFIHPLPLETKLLQDNLLAALSYLKKLNYENLEVVQKMLIEAPNLHLKRHPGNLRNPIKRILLDCLLRSEVRSVPEEVKSAAVTIRTLAMEQLGGDGQPCGDGLYVSDSELKEPRGEETRIELEIESTLQISCHLLQIMCNWKEDFSTLLQEECQTIFSGSNGVDFTSASGIGTSSRGSSGRGSNPSADDMQLKEESLAPDVTNGGVELTWTNTMAPNTPDDPEAVESDGDLAETAEEKLLTRIADEAAEIGYALVGCAMERTARSSGVILKRPVRKYLHSGISKKACRGLGNGLNVKEDQLGMILKIAEKMPAISPRVMDNVKRRLGME